MSNKPRVYKLRRGTYWCAQVGWACMVFPTWDEAIEQVMTSGFPD